MKRSVALFGLAVGAAASVAGAQATLTYSDQHCEAHSYFDPGSVGNSGLSTNPPGTGFDYAAVEDRPFTGGGFSGHGYADEAVTFTASNPGIGGQFTSALLEACTSAEVYTSFVQPGGTHTLEESYGLAMGEIHFNLSQPMIWSWNGVAQGTSYNTGSFHAVGAEFTLTDINLGTSYVNLLQTTINGVGNFFIPFSFGGVLPAGDYRLTWAHESICTGGNTAFGNYPTAAGGAPLVSCIPSTFTVTPLPAPGAVALLGLGGLAAARRRRPRPVCPIG